MILYMQDSGSKTCYIDGEPERVAESQIRAAKLRILQKTFNEHFPKDKKEDENSTHEISVLKTTKLQKLSGSRKRIILNAHGDPESFRDDNGTAMAKRLIDAGLDYETKEIWVIACLVGVQRQDNKDPEAFGDLSKSKFSKKFYEALSDAVWFQGKKLDIKIYVPRGWVTYSGATWKRIGAGEGRQLTFTKVYVATEDKEFIGLDGAGKKIYKQVHGPADKEEYDFWEGGMLLVKFI